MKKAHSEQKKIALNIHSGVIDKILSEQRKYRSDIFIDKGIDINTTSLTTMR